jgi:STE24 endopeptidase
MNAFFVIILVALVLEFGLGLVADLMNLRSLRSDPPAELQGVFEAKEYRRSQEYTRITTRFEIGTGAVKLALLLVFWFAGGFNTLDQVVRDWGLVSVASGLMYLGLLTLGYIVLMTPFDIYSTFVIEGRFGFNRTAPGTFVADRLKGLALAVVLGGPLLAGVLAFFEYAGTLAWLYAWVAVTAFLLAAQFVAPTWIMPLFNKFTPMETGELRDAILDYAGKVGFAVDNILVMDGSKRSSKANAFFTGFGRHKRIALFDTLVENHTVPELVAVLAHEIGHYKKKHVLQGVVVGALHSGLMFYLLSVFLGSAGLYDAFFMEETSVYAGLLFFALLYTPIEVVLSMALQYVSRRHEYEADVWAAQTVDGPEALVSGLKKLAADTLSNLSPHPLYVFLNYSHPPLLQRVQAIRRVSSTAAVTSA